MHSFAAWELAACWIVWALPIGRRIALGPKRKSVALVRSATLGLLLELAAVLMVSLLQRPEGDPAPAGAVAASMLLAPAGALLAWGSVRHLGKQWRIEAGLYDDHELVRTGPYRFLRHPIYASLLAMLLATGLLISRFPVLAAALAVFVTGTEIRVRAEDALLASRFGPLFDEYRRRVPAYLPFLR